MKKHFFYFLIFIIFTSLTAVAQFKYSFSIQSQTYQPLTGGTIVNGSTLWDTENFQIPIGFAFQMNGASVTTLDLIQGQIAATDTTIVNGFLMTNADLWDRGNATSSASKSPIRYTLSGTMPNRIFKLEVFNAGFYDEYGIYGTNNDSVSLQLWLYETSNIVEIKYGPSRVSHMMDYFDNGQPGIAYFKNFNLSNGNIDNIYYLHGNPSSPSLDSTNNLNLVTGLSSFPVSGTVYRFTPKNATIVIDKISLLENVIAYPTVCRDKLTVENNTSKLITYDLISASGVSVRHQNYMQPGVTSINTTDLANGSYFLRLQLDGAIKAIPFLK